MASSSTLFFSISFFITQIFSLNLVIKSTLMYPLTCSNYNHTCDSYLYHISKGRNPEEIASFYSVNTSRITPIKHNSDTDYLVSVRCGCEQDNSGHGYYLYDSVYERKSGESVEYISNEYYSGQVWKVSGDDEEELTVHLVCGCRENEAQEVVTYTIQSKDTLIGISDLLSPSSQMAETAFLCLSEDPANRPEMRDVVSILAQIVMASIEWEASLGGTSQVFSGLFNGR